MAPGGDCIECHASGEGPRYTVAGTVMGKANDDENCAGIGGVTVEITDANGDIFNLATTQDGNFFYGARGEDESPAPTKPIVFPYTARVVQGAKARAMVASQSDGDCASCHTASGEHGAPGRILAP